MSVREQCIIHVHQWFAAACVSAISAAASIGCTVTSGPEQTQPSVDAAAVTRADSADASAPAEAAAVDSRPATSADRYASAVVSFTPGGCAGFGRDAMPKVVFGPPEGGGASQGGLDVVSLGSGGSIVLSFEANPIIDADGPDFLVFENAFNLGDDPAAPFAELGEVSVSEDGVIWKTFACTSTSFPYGDCAGWRPVYSASSSGISALDAAGAGGDPFDLRVLGVARAKFVRIRDLGRQTCPANSTQITNGFDLDGIASLHSERP
jgi:hypothetical protein